MDESSQLRSSADSREFLDRGNILKPPECTGQRLRPAFGGEKILERLQRHDLAVRMLAQGSVQTLPTPCRDRRDRGIWVDAYHDKVVRRIPRLHRVSGIEEALIVDLSCHNNHALVAFALSKSSHPNNRRTNSRLNPEEFPRKRGGFRHLR